MYAILTGTIITVHQNWPFYYRTADRAVRHTIICYHRSAN